MTNTIRKTKMVAGLVQTGRDRCLRTGVGTHGRNLLLASTALASVLASGAAGAACYSGPFPTTNAVTISGICVANTSFSGVLANTGTITTDGITVTNSQIGTVASPGRIDSSGTLTGGITVDAASSITSSLAFGNPTISVTGPFSGGISNAGTLAGREGIDVVNPTSFSGGISNSGSITSLFDGIFVVGNGSTISGNITNSGSISFDQGVGIRIVQSNYVGDIVNTASGSIIWKDISPPTPGRALWIAQNTSIAGGVINAGSMFGFDGIYVDNTNQFGGTTGIVNTGTITGRHAAILVGGDTPALASGTITGGIRNAGTLAGGFGIALNNVTSFSGGILNSGTITSASFSSGILLSNVGSFSGDLNNTGMITAGTAIQVNAGVNFTGGAAIINSGTISGSTFAINTQTATSAVTIVQTDGHINGDIALSANADTVTVTGGVIAGNILGAGTSNTVNFALDNGTFVYDAAYQISGVNQFNVNSGTVVLNGGSNSASNVVVNGGTLQVGDAGHTAAALTSANPINVLGTLTGYGTVNGDVAVGPGGTLAGFGTVNGDVAIGAGGRLAPGGGGPGTLTVTGNLVLASSAAYLAQFSGANASKTVVSGTASLDGALQLAGTARAGTYVILTAASGVTGSFSSVVSTVTGVRNPQLVYLGNEVDLVFDPATVLTPNLPANPRAVGTPLDNILQSGGPLPGGLQILPNLTGADLANALTLLSGEAATGAQGSAFQLMGGFLGLMSDPFSEGRGGGAALGFAATDGTLPPEVASAYAAVQKAAPVKTGFAQRWSLWGGAYGGGNRTDGDAAVVGSHDVSVRAAGFAAGADYRMTPATTVGFALAGGNGNWSLAQGLGSGRDDAFQVGVYGRTVSGPAYVSVALAAAEHWLSTSRTALAAAPLSARFTAQSYGARLEAGYRAAAPVAAVTPYAALQMQAFVTPRYGETDTSGAGLGLGFAARTARDTRAEVGARFDRLVALNSTTLLTLRGKLAYAHDWISDPSLAATFLALPGASFIVTGAAPARDSLLVSAGAEAQLAGGWVLAGKFDGEFAVHSRTYGGSGTFRYAW